MHQQAFPGWYFSNPLFQKNYFRTASPRAIQQVGVRTGSFRGKPPVLQHCAMTSATCAVVDVSIYQDTQTREVSAILERPQL